MDNFSGSKHAVLDNLKSLEYGEHVQFFNGDVADKEKLRVVFKSFKDIKTVLFCLSV